MLKIVKFIMYTLVFIIYLILPILRPCYSKYPLGVIHLGFLCSHHDSKTWVLADPFLLKCALSLRLQFMGYLRYFHIRLRVFIVNNFHLKLQIMLFVDLGMILILKLDIKRYGMAHQKYPTDQIQSNYLIQQLDLTLKIELNHAH